MNEWPMVKLGDACAINPRRDKSVINDTEISFIEMKSLLENGSVYPIITQAKDYLKGYTPFQHGDVLVAKITPCFQNGKIGTASLPTKFGFGTTEFHVLRPKISLLPEYLTAFLRQPHILLSGERKMTGSGGQRRVPKSFLEQLIIPLPPLGEQKRIAEILGKVARMADLVQSEISETQSLTNELLMQLTRGTTKKKPLGIITLSKPDYGISQPSMPYDPSIGRYVRITDIDENGELHDKAVSPKTGGNPLSTKKLLQSGDLVIARSGATVGKSYLHYRDKVPHWFAGYLIRFAIDPEIISPEIVFDYTKTIEYRAWIDSRKQTAAQPNISAQIYSQELQIPIPTQDAQKTYLHKRKEVYATNKLLHQKLALLQELQRSLSARAFAGLL